AEVGLARIALSRGDTAGARARLERALAADPRNVEGHVAYGTLLWNARELPAAEKAFQAAVNLVPLHALALCRLGAVKLEREDADGAVQRLVSASNEDPKLAEARRWLGRALLAKNETSGAITQLRKAVELERGNRENHLHLGVALERSGALPEAVEAYRAAAAIDPKYVEAWERIGSLYAANGRCEDAMPAYERGIAAAPRLARLKLALGDCKAKLGKNDEAVRIFKDVMKSDPSAVQALYRLARALHESEGARIALPVYERAAREDPKNPMPHYYLGYLYKERNQKQRAVQEFRRYLELRPDAEEKKDIENEIEDLGGARGKR
ncbi:MAG TPA: tetratricopeptide repeat protein, partial [Anaeromyxobacter sp.]